MQIYLNMPSLQIITLDKEENRTDGLEYKREADAEPQTRSNHKHDANVLLR